uniref:TF-B3 domain-containing protein n=1 Tax=Lactuca sativa TaxID=4236 RepID=A0A9R1WXH4_LACSA|nr:hypothetical protein LSAT_V11C900455520 [Lactuca sativa]
MEGSSTDDQRTTTEATSIVAAPMTMPPLISSGGSMVLDTNEAGLEASFLNSHSKAEIVDMLRKHTYNDELEQKDSHPNDIGKLNRLVIPKQHAEKHFPLQTESTSKGVLLHFEDIGMKEKNLKAGDIVSFQRSTDSDKQLYIDWKTKNGSGSSNIQEQATLQHVQER